MPPRKFHIAHIVPDTLLHGLHGYSRIFEVVRVSYLLANSKAVVADFRPDTFLESDFVDAVAFAPPKQVTETCHALLADEFGRKALEMRGENAIRKRDICPILLHALEEIP